MSSEVDYKVVDLLLSTEILNKDCRSNPVFHECVNELASLSTTRLATEPGYLRDCHKKAIDENHKLAFDNYSTFICTAECTREIFQDFVEVDKQNDTLLSNIPKWKKSCETFLDSCKKSAALTQMNNLTLQKHNQILEILEVPQLLEACIRNGHIDEALEVIAHTRKLDRRRHSYHHNRLLKHSTGDSVNKVIAGVALECRAAAQKLLEHLFLQLSGDLQLPACLKIVGYLRRMDCLPEQLLRLKFLQCRDAHLSCLLQSLASTGDAFFHATKYMEIARVGIFDIATQYRAVFSEDDGPGVLCGLEPHPDPSSASSGTGSSGQSGSALLFSSWLVRRVRKLLAVLATDLEVVVDSVPGTASSGSSTTPGSKMQSLLAQAMYFGLSLARIGCDFRPLFLRPFYRATLRFIRGRLDDVVDAYPGQLCCQQWTSNRHGDASQQQLPQVSLATSIHDHRTRLATQSGNTEIVPPNQLMRHPLMAVLANQLLTILEDVRLCCPRVLKSSICFEFESCLEAVMEETQRFCVDEGLDQQQQHEGPQKQRSENMRQMLAVMVTVLVPHVDLCLSALFGPGAGSCMDVDRLALSLRVLLPDALFDADIEESRAIVAEEDLEPTTDEESRAIAAEEDLEPTNDEETREIVAEEDLEPTKDEESPEIVAEEDLEPTNDEESREIVAEEDLEPTENEESRVIAAEEDLEPTNYEESPEIVAEEDLESTENEESQTIVADKDMKPTIDEESRVIAAEEDLEPTTDEESRAIAAEEDLEPTNYEESPEIVAEEDPESTENEASQTIAEDEDIGILRTEKEYVESLASTKLEEKERAERTKLMLYPSCVEDGQSFNLETSIPGNSGIDEAAITKPGEVDKALVKDTNSIDLSNDDDKPNSSGNDEGDEKELFQVLEEVPGIPEDRESDVFAAVKAEEVALLEKACDKVKCDEDLSKQS